MKHLARTTRKSLSRSPRRSGLAPLEFVLAIPLLLFVTALIINFAEAARWKIRAQGNARYSADRSLGFRSGEHDPNPYNWPNPATLTHSGADDLTQVDQYWKNDPDISVDVINGPVFSGFGSTPITIKYGQASGVKSNPELEMHEGMHQGTAHVSRGYFHAPNIMPDGGMFDFTVRREMLDGDWNFSDMGYWNNQDHRVRKRYTVNPKTDGAYLPGVPQLKGVLDAAHNRLRSNPLQSWLTPIDEDDEFRIYTGGSPDFHPRPTGNIDETQPFPFWPVWYRTNPPPPQASLFDRFLSSVRRRPGVMARAFIGMYQREISRQRGSPPLVPPQPPPPGGEPWPILEGKVSQLQDFINRLPPQYQ